MPLRIPRLKENPPSREEVTRFTRAVANGIGRAFTAEVVIENFGPYSVPEVCAHAFLIKLREGKTAEGASFQTFVLKTQSKNPPFWEPFTLFS